MSRKSLLFLCAMLIALGLSAATVRAQDSSQSSSDNSAQSSSAQSSDQNANQSTSSSSSQTSDQNAQAGGTQGAENAGTAGTAHHHRGMHRRGTTVRGCLQKSDDTFTLTTKSGKSYTLEAGQGVDLAPHVGHLVSVTGHKSAGAAAAGGGAAGASSNASAGGGAAASTPTLQVTHLKHISDTCPSGGGSTSGAAGTTPK